MASNQYRVVLRTGINEKYFDYHFWYQLSDGTWSNKHGELAETNLGAGVTPFTQGTSGWTFESPTGTYVDFYDSEIYAYIITLD